MGAPCQGDHVVVIDTGRASCTRCGEADQERLVRDGFSLGPDELAKVDLKAVPASLALVVAVALGLMVVARPMQEIRGTIMLIPERTASPPHKATCLMSTLATNPELAAAIIPSPAGVEQFYCTCDEPPPVVPELFAQMTPAEFAEFRVHFNAARPHVCCGCGGLCDSGHPCPMAYNCQRCPALSPKGGA